MSGRTLEVTLKLKLEVDYEFDVQKLAQQIEAATSAKDTSFAAEMWKLGDYVDMYVQSIEERNVVYFVEE